MSYGITPTGFVTKDLSTIVADLQNKAIEVFGPNTDLRSTNPLMIYINMVAQDTQTQWNVLADMYANIFIITATGTALDQLAVDRGIQRQSPVKANGIVTVTAPAGTIVPGASVFSTSGDNITFFESTSTMGVGETTETFDDIGGYPYEVTLANQATGSYGSGKVSVQIFPTDLTEVDTLTDTGQFTCDYANPSVIETYDNPASATVTVVYYNYATTSDTTTVEARFAGEAGNVGPAQINILVTSISGVTAVSNAASTSSGEEEETDPAFRIRLINVPVAEWTEADLESTVENINGIKSATVDDGELIELFTDADQDPESTYYKVDLSINTTDVFRVTFYDDSAGTRTEFVPVVSDPSAGEYRLGQEDSPIEDQLEYGTPMTTSDTLTVTYMNAAVGVGVFTLKVVADAPPLTSTLVDSIENIVKSAKPFGVSFFISEPTFSQIAMTITLVIGGIYTLSDVTPSITSGITAYIDSLDIADPLRHYRIVDVIMDVTGIVDITTVQYSVQSEILARTVGDTDTPLHAAITLPDTITDEDDYLYMEDSDYQLTSNEVDWAITTNAMLYAKAFDDPAYDDQTVKANDDTDDDMTLLPSSPVVGDAYYFGSKIPFTNLEIRISQVGTHTHTIVWEYYNGAWIDLSTAHNLVDNTLGFTVGGATPYNVGFTLPTDWLITTIDSDDAYWLRARVSALDSTGAQPKGRQSWIKSTGIDLTGAGLNDEGSSETDQTTEAADLATDDMTLLPADTGTYIVGDSYYFGSDGKFLSLGLTISTAGVGVWDGVWEYSQGGTTYAALSNVSDPTNSSRTFDTAGTHIVSFDLPSDWATADWNAITGKYWVRYRLTTGDGDPTTQPLGRISWVGGHVPIKDKVYTLSAYDIPADTTIAGQADVKYTEGTVSLQE